jgi:hydrogenase 3 maturation protease
MNDKSFCIVGIGNAIRSDDGVGTYVCQKMEEKNLANVTSLGVHQLDISMAEELSKYDTVVLVDAAEMEEDLFFEELSAESQPLSFTHHINASMLVALTKKLYATNTVFYIGAVKGINFDFGNTISLSTLKYADILVEKICSLLAELNA